MSAATAGWTVGAHYLGSVTGVLLSLVLEARLRSRTRLTVGLALVVLGTLGFAAIPAWPWALAGVLAIGVGYGMLVVAVNAQFAAGFGDRSATLIILVNAAFGLGAVIGPIVYGAFSNSSGNFRLAFLLAAALGALILPLGWAAPELEHRRQPPVARAGRVMPLALGSFVALFLLYTAAETDASGWMATHLTAHGYFQAAAAGLTAAFWAALTVGRLLSAPVSFRLGPRLMVGGALTGVIVVTLTADIDALMAVAYIMIGLLLAPIFPVTFAWMGSALPGARGAAALALLGALAGGLIFPVLVGRVIGWTSPDALPPALAAIA